METYIFSIKVMKMENNAEPKFKCQICKMILEKSDLIHGAHRLVCPKCGHPPDEMCRLDHVCECNHEIQSGRRTCPECHAFICECGSHDVAVISRVTGYLAELGGWGAGKRAEFNDRTRYDIESGTIT